MGYLILQKIVFMVNKEKLLRPERNFIVKIKL